MMRFGFCLGAALILSLASCKGDESSNEVNPQANQAQQVAKKDQPAPKATGAKCPFVYTQLPVGTPDPTRRVYTCVERYAHLYSKGPDSAEILSKAVMAKCKDEIVKYVDQEAKKAGVRPPYKEAFESWQGHTLPIIAEARSRRCFAD
ncbi:hypothetical protein [Sphingomonas alba]|uniref:Lipoprotein n=1 Tax=Sphingomonas alba TaxID=2908208 RepID=A0ABT0RNS7_9SPHN|nr:hypothetical protein [Sphingomonas alba]MCL6684306.1 hypothetical protein [Sphingomonas alba]